MTRPLSTDIRSRLVCAVQGGDDAALGGEAVPGRCLDGDQMGWSNGSGRERSATAAGRGPTLAPAGGACGGDPGAGRGSPRHHLGRDRGASGSGAHRGEDGAEQRVAGCSIRHGMRFKKNRARQRAGAAHCRAAPRAWRELQPGWTPTGWFHRRDGASTKMARVRGRAQRGERCRAPVPHGHWMTTTFVGALRPPADRADGALRADERRGVPRLCRTGSGADARSRGHRDHGQSARPQAARCAPGIEAPVPSSSAATL